MEEKYYIYQYNREDGRPYYIVKGIKYRHSKGEVYPPKDKTRIIFIVENVSEQTSFAFERFWIKVYGRKDLGTGILRNKTDGGEGSSGAIRSIETRRKMSEVSKGKLKHSEETNLRLSEITKKSMTEERRLQQSEMALAQYANNRKPASSCFNKGCISINKGKTMPVSTCVHCGLQTSSNNIKRWHNDNCKSKEITV